MALLSHRQGLSFAVMLAIFPCVFFASSTSDPPAATYRTSASEVRITFFATDENNRLVKTLEKNDFAVVDGEMVVRDFRSLARSNETALDIVVLVDASESVNPRFPAITQGVLRLISQNSETPGDTISVETFAGMQPALLCSTDCGDPDTEERLLSLKPAGSTPLFDSLAFSARFLSDRHKRDLRQVIILFSDGNDTISRNSSRDALDAVIASGALLYTINLDSSGRVSNGSFALQQMAEATGGRSFSMQDGAANVLQAVLADLRASYVVTYQLPNRVAGFHSLRILPKHNLNLRFHCRRGYFYEENH